MTTPSDDDSAGETSSPQPARPARRVRRHVVPDEPAGRSDRPDSERDEIWGDPAPDTLEQLRRDVPPHHGG
jgi:hypothetical protein